MFIYTHNWYFIESLIFCNFVSDFSSSIEYLFIEQIIKGLYLELNAKLHNIPVLGIAVSKSFRERIRSNLELSDAVILIGRHGDELGLGENKRTIVLVVRVHAICAVGVINAVVVSTLAALARLHRAVISVIVVRVENSRTGQVSHSCGLFWRLAFRTTWSRWTRISRSRVVWIVFAQVDYVKAWLITMHRVKYDLFEI